ncbi:transglycosylase domain-containing protein, partial [Streptomyces venezuelae]
ARKSRPRRLLRTLLWLLLLGTLLLAGAFAAGYLLVEIPPANAAAVAQSNVYLYRDGSTLARDGETNRENVRLDRVPLTVRRAVLAAEDRDFHTSRAVDPKAMVRAAWNTVTGKGRQSGSTITQQYVKNYYLGQEQTLTRKAKEFFIAIKLGREKSKEEILQGYLNTSYFGRNAYGVQAAARAYYGKDVEDLDTAEGAYLASVLKAPSAYDVTTHPENRAKAVARWNYVLDGMVTEGWLTRADRATAAFPTPQT